MTYYDPASAAISGIIALVGLLIIVVLLSKLFRSKLWVEDTYNEMEVGAIHGYVRKKHPEILKELTLLEVSEKSKFRQKLEQEVVNEYFPNDEKKK